MISLVELFVRMVERSPDKRDYELIDKLAITIPDELKNDLGWKAELVMRASHIRELERVMNSAGNVVRRKVELDGEEWAMKAADRVWRRIEDQLPPSASTAVAKCFFYGAICMAFIGGAGVILGMNLTEQKHEIASRSTQALTENEFATCVNAASYEASQIRSGKVVAHDAAVFRDAARTCAAEYADRRAAL